MKDMPFIYIISNAGWLVIHGNAIIRHLFRHYNGNVTACITLNDKDML
jgi:hypothetical protein